LINSLTEEQFFGILTGLEPKTAGQSARLKVIGNGLGEAVFLPKISEILPTQLITTPPIINIRTKPNPVKR